VNTPAESCLARSATLLDRGRPNPMEFVRQDRNHAVNALTVQDGQISTFNTIFACTSREAIRDLLVSEGHCLDISTAVLFTWSFTIFLHVLILVLPERSVWRLHIPRQRKIGTVPLFATGLL